jgi:hypothetical protein
MHYKSVRNGVWCWNEFADLAHTGSLACDCSSEGPFYCDNNFLVGIDYQNDNNTWIGSISVCSRFLCGGAQLSERASRVQTQIALLSTLVELDIVNYDFDTQHSLRGTLRTSLWFCVGGWRLLARLASQLALLTLLTSLQVSGNALLVGTLATQLSVLNGIMYFLVDNCDFVGVLPNMSRWSNLVGVHVGNNRFIGPAPNVASASLLQQYQCMSNFLNGVFVSSLPSFCRRSNKRC